MTTSLTGIDIRKALLAEGERPSDYDEQAIWTSIDNVMTRNPELADPDPDTIVLIAAGFKVRN